jgi:hypothetical protein
MTHHRAERRGARGTGRPSGPGSGGRAAALVVGLVLGATAPVAGQGDDDSMAGPDPGDLAAEFVADFTGGDYDRTYLEPAGYNPEVVRPDPRGLVIRIPRGLGNPAAVGVTPRFRVRGDFEIIGDFEILKADPPTEGYGLGVQIWVEADAPDRPAATIERGLIPDEGEWFTSTQITGPEDDRQYRPERAPAASRSGRLRMVRVGPIVSTSYADGEGPFQLLRSFELGTRDLDLVRFAADTGVSDLPFEALLTRLEIRAEAFPGMPGEERRFSPLWWAALAVVPLTVGLIVFARRSRDRPAAD